MAKPSFYREPEKKATHPAGRKSLVGKRNRSQAEKGKAIFLQPKFLRVFIASSQATLR